MKSPAFLNPDVPLNGSRPLPHDFREFAAYVWRKNRGLWTLFFIQDIVHFMRYPVSFIIVGRIIDALKAASPGDGIPHRVLVLLFIQACVLFFGELAHIWTAHIIVHWKPKLLE